MSLSASSRIASISSPDNRVLALVRSLALRKYREQTGLFLVEGNEFAMRAIANGFRIRHLLVDSNHQHDAALRTALDVASSATAQISLVATALLSRISGRDNPQKLILVTEQRWASDLPAHLHENDTVLALDRVRDPRNLGAIIRTAEATGVRMLVLVGSCCDPYAPEAVRASAGSLFAVPLMKAATADFLELRHRWSADVIGAHVAATADFRAARRGPVLLLMGNESDGLGEDLTRVCTRMVRIPMMAGVSSLNLAAATALLLYELRLPYLRI